MQSLPRFRHHWQWAVGAALLGFAWPSAGAQQAQAAQPRPKSTTVSETADFITQDYARTHPDLGSAYALVEAGHSAWLRERSAFPTAASAAGKTARPDEARSAPGESGGIQVYLNGHRVGGVQWLRTLPASSIRVIRHLNGLEAQARYGAGHSQGVIYVSTSPAWDHVW